MSPEIADAFDPRLEAARAALDETATLVATGQRLRQLASTDDASLDVLSGADALRAANRVGLLAGSFNPLTIAHAELGAAALRSGAVDLLAWTISTTTLDKEHVARATLIDRVAQLESFARFTGLSAVIAVNRGLYADQVEALRRILAQDAEIAVIVGFDKAVQIFDARYYADRESALSRLFAGARLLVAPRGESDEQQLRALLCRPENAAYASRVAYLTVPPEVRKASSTEARSNAGREQGTLRLNALRRLLTPEGFALATTDDPYLQPASEAWDRYAWRARWETLLAASTPEATGTLPPISQLVSAALRRDSLGERIRTALSAGDIAHVRSALDTVGELATAGYESFAG